MIAKSSRFMAIVAILLWMAPVICHSAEMDKSYFLSKLTDGNLDPVTFSTLNKLAKSKDAPAPLKEALREGLASSDKVIQLRALMALRDTDLLTSEVLSLLKKEPSTEVKSQCLRSRHEIT